FLFPMPRISLGSNLSAGRDRGRDAAIAAITRAYSSRTDLLAPSCGIRVYPFLRSRHQSSSQNRRHRRSRISLLIAGTLLRSWRSFSRVSVHVLGGFESL